MDWLAPGSIPTYTCVFCVALRFVPFFRAIISNGRSVRFVDGLRLGRIDLERLPPSLGDFETATAIASNPVDN